MRRYFEQIEQEFIEKTILMTDQYKLVAIIM